MVSTADTELRAGRGHRKNRKVSTNLWTPPKPKKTQDTSFSTLTSSILVLAVTKRKPARFSATKAVKSNARDLVGQPKPARVLSDKPRTGRQAKHKPKLQDVLQREE